MTAPASSLPRTLSAHMQFGIAHRIGQEVAAVHAGDVDRNARFPQETIDALKNAGLLAALVPTSLGGMGMPITALAAICTALGQYCSASAMVFAMHHIQVACIVRHGLHTEYFRSYCQELVSRQMLIGSVTSEVGIGGDTRSSLCALEASTTRYKLEKNASTMSYGAHADDLFITCRRSPDAAGSDQVMVLARKGEFTLEQTSQWDTLGMRGTCSPGFKVLAHGHMDQVVPGGFSHASRATMVPFSHILWAGVWLGIATDAVARAASTVRSAARRSPGTMPPTALRLAELAAKLQSMRAEAKEAAASFEGLPGDANAEELTSIGFSLKMNQLKISSSSAAVEIVQQALLICGIQGYRNDSSCSIGRHLRDVLSAPLMIGNDRIHAQNASLLLVHKDV